MYRKPHPDRKDIPRLIKNSLKKNGDFCFYCGEHSNCIEHVIPVSKGGKNNIENLRLSCDSCNSRKHLFSIDEHRLREDMRHKKITPLTKKQIDYIVSIGFTVKDAVSFKFHGE